MAQVCRLPGDGENPPAELWIGPSGRDEAEELRRGQGDGQFVEGAGHASRGGEGGPVGGAGERGLKLRALIVAYTDCMKAVKLSRSAAVLGHSQSKSTPSNP